MTPDAKGTPLQELEPGSTFGPYRIVRLLGRGGMGAVYEAEHLADGRIVALKLLSVDLDKMDSRERFLREGQIAAAINHPNAVYIYGTEEIEGTPAITMELVPGGTLDEKIKERGALPWNEAVEDILQVIDGLDAAFAAGVLHRDVKPSNCFIGNGGEIKIGDFGLSKPVDSDEQKKLTQTGLFLGTPVFSSPEQLLGETLDVRSDIYAVGVTFYSLLTGELPYHSGSMMQVVAAVLNGVPAPMTNFRKDLPPGVIDVVMKAMARKASDRYQTYEEFREAVAALRVAEVAPATLWDRFRATVVDWLVNIMLVWIISILFLSNIFVGGGKAADWRATVISLVITLLVVGIPEALRGMSIGKWLVGIRVIGPDGLPPGFVREAGRILILATADLASIAAQRMVHDQNKQAAATLMVSAIIRGSLLVTVRRSNGWRMLHDIITGTRVTRPRAAATQRRGETHKTVAPVMSGNEQHIGPYVVLGTTGDGSGVMNGWDGAMRRAVWIVPRTEQAEEASAARRSLSRLTRLRWVGGRRQPGDAWDAYEAPIGEPLRARLARPVPWNVQQNWLLDISNELVAAAQDGTALPNMTADALWVTPTDRLVFLEGPALLASQPDAASNALVSQPSLIAQVFDRIDASTAAGVPMPRYAARTVASARIAENPAAVRAMVQETVGRPIAVTRARRAGLIAATFAPVVLFSAIGGYTTSQAMKLDRKGFMMSGLLSFIGDSLSATPDSVKARAARAAADKSREKRVGAAMDYLGLTETSVPDTITPMDTLRARRKLAEVYLVTALSDRMRDTVKGSLFGNTPKEQRRRLAIMERNKTVDSALARDARRLVDSVWKGQIPGNGPGTIQKFIPFVLVATILVLGACVSLIAGLLVRRGPLMRGFQLDAVTASGKPAGRVRMLVRSVVIWSALLVPVPWFLIARSVSAATLANVMVATVALYVVGWAVGVWMALREPARGVPERVSGTWLVPE